MNGSQSNLKLNLKYNLITNIFVLFQIFNIKRRKKFQCIIFHKSQKRHLSQVNLPSKLSYNCSNIIYINLFLLPIVANRRLLNIQVSID